MILWLFRLPVENKNMIEDKVFGHIANLMLLHPFLLFLIALLQVSFSDSLSIYFGLLEE